MHAPGVPDVRRAARRAPSAARPRPRRAGAAARRGRAASASSTCTRRSWRTRDAGTPRDFAELFDLLHNRIFADPARSGATPNVPEGCCAAVSALIEADRRPAATIAEPIDFYGLNYYMPTRIAAGSATADARRPAPQARRRCRSTSRPSRRRPTGFGWPIAPRVPHHGARELRQALPGGAATRLHHRGRRELRRPVDSTARATTRPASTTSPTTSRRRSPARPRAADRRPARLLHLDPAWTTGSGPLASSSGSDSCTSTSRRSSAPEGLVPLAAAGRSQLVLARRSAAGSARSDDRVVAMEIHHRHRRHRPARRDHRHLPDRRPTTPSYA